MVKFLMKAPLTAIIFAALWYFAAVFMPVSQGYSESLTAFQMPLSGYILTIAYGLWLSVIAAIIIGYTKVKEMKAVLLTLLVFLITQWLAPSLQQFQFGETTGVMTTADLCFKLAAGAVATLFLMVLVLLLFRHPPEPSPRADAPPHVPDKYKIKKLDFAIKLVVLPVIYCVLYFLVWHFLFRRTEAARVYYTGSPDYSTFVKEIVYMLLNDVRQVPMALVKGLVYALGLLPLLMLLPAKRVIFIVTSIMVLIGPALQMLIPSPVMPDAVRMAHLLELGVDAVVYGGLAGIMLHTSLQKPEIHIPVTAPAQPAKGSAKSSARTPAKIPANAPAKFGAKN